MIKTRSLPFLQLIWSLWSGRDRDCIHGSSGSTELLKLVRQKKLSCFSLFLYTARAILKILQEDNRKTPQSYRVDQNTSSFTKKYNLPILKSLFIPWRTIFAKYFEFWHPNPSKNAVLTALHPFFNCSGTSIQSWLGPSTSEPKKGLIIRILWTNFGGKSCYKKIFYSKLKKNDIFSNPRWPRPWFCVVSKILCVVLPCEALLKF